jgi:general stress protein 26
MAVAKRTGPDFLFLANAHSQKFNDLENGPPEVNVSFLNSSNQDWVSVTGECVTSDNADPRIKEIWSKGTKAWFGDLGDGVHTGGPEDPRMKLIEIKAKRKSTMHTIMRCRGYCTDFWNRHHILEARGRRSGFHEGDCWRQPYWRCRCHWYSSRDQGRRA